MDFLSLITAIPSLMSAYKGETSDPYRKKKEEINAALGDTNNPLYQQLYGQYRQQGAGDLSRGIAELQGQNRMNTKLGRTPLFDSERGGEQLFRQLMQGYEGLGTQADTKTRQNLQGQLGNYTSMTQPAAASNAQRLDFYQGVQDLLTGKQVKRPTMQQPDQMGEFLKKLTELQKTQAPATSSWNY